MGKFYSRYIVKNKPSRSLVLTIIWKGTLYIIMHMQISEEPINIKEIQAL